MIIGIVAMDKNNLIGTGWDSFCGMPWHNPEDLKHFKTTTMGKTIVMGRKTYELVGKQLTGRKVIVISTSLDMELFPNAIIVNNVDDIIKKYKKNLSEDIFIAGGLSIYKLFMNDMHQILISRISGEYEGNVYFPKEYSTLYHKDVEIHLKTFDLEFWTNIQEELKGDI